MDIADLVSDIDYQLSGMTDSAGEVFGISALDTGEIFIKAPSGQFFLLAITEVDAETVSFIEDWS